MPSNLVVWVSVYCGTGVTLASAYYVFNRVKRRNRFAENPPGSSEGPAFIAFAVSVVMLLWPFFLTALLLSSSGLIPKACELWSRVIDHNEFFSTKRTVKSFEQKGAHIHHITSVEAAERVVRVTDPLNRTPDVPFGHLNAGWKAFLLQHKNGYKLWAFEIQGQVPDQRTIDIPEPGTYPGRQLGYAWVSRKGIEAEFLYEWN